MKVDFKKPTAIIAEFVTVYMNKLSASSTIVVFGSFFKTTFLYNDVAFNLFFIEIHSRKKENMKPVFFE